MITVFLLDPSFFIIGTAFLVAIGCVMAVALFELTMHIASCIKHAKHRYDQVKLFDGYDVVREAEMIAMMVSEEVEEFDD